MNERETISAITPDWSRELPHRFWDPGRNLLKAIRGYQRINQEQGLAPAWLKKVTILRHRFWSIITQCEIDLSCRIGGGLLLPHPNGIVIHPKVAIGPNCLIFHQVTLGAGGPIPGVPCIGGHVDIGAGAKILGGVTSGNHVKVGANSVDMWDVH